MKTTATIIGLILSTGSIFAQAPIVYINFVSHNEPNQNLHLSGNYLPMKSNVLQLAAIIDSKFAAWNLQTCDGFAKGALDNEGAANNLFKTLAAFPYSDNIEIDPRPKQSFYPTIADLYHIIDSLGGNPSTTLGGFVYSTTNQTLAPIDWYQYQDTVYSSSASYPTVKWKCNIMWGAGSYPPHNDDIEDYGIWKPDTVSYTNTFNAFYNHNPQRNVWFIGNGCPPANTNHPVNPGSFDSTDAVTDVTTPLKNFIDSIQGNLLPQNKFYSVCITINQSSFGPTLFSKISQICDSVNSWGTTKIQWANLSEKLTAFQSWQLSTGLDSSKWLCGQTITSIEKNDKSGNFNVYPNPFNNILSVEVSGKRERAIEIFDFLGRVIFSQTIQSELTVDPSEFPTGIYLIKVDKQTKKVIKN